MSSANAPSTTSGICRRSSCDGRASTYANASAASTSKIAPLAAYGGNGSPARASSKRPNASYVSRANVVCTNARADDSRGNSPLLSSLELGAAFSHGRATMSTRRIPDEASNAAAASTSPRCSA